MAGKATGLKLGGKTHRLRYDLNALAALEERLGLKSLTDFENLEVRIGTIRTMLWAGLLHENPDLTEQEVGAMVDGSNMNEVVEGVTRALVESFGKQSGKANGKPGSP